MITSSLGVKISNWVIENLEFIKAQKDSKPKGHRGVVFGLQDLQTSQMKELLAENDFPYNELKHIEEELINKYKVPVKKYAASGIMLVYAEKGYKCKWHTDDTDNEHEYTTRFNVLLNKPFKGGDPIIKKNGLKETIPVKQYEPWMCLSGKYEHSTVKTEGPSPRILLSYGYDINKKLLENLGYL